MSGMSADDRDWFAKQFTPIYDALHEMRTNAVRTEERLMAHTADHAVCPKVDRHERSCHSIAKAVTLMAAAAGTAAAVVKVMQAF